MLTLMLMQFAFMQQIDGPSACIYTTHFNKQRCQGTVIFVDLTLTNSNMEDAGCWCWVLGAGAVPVPFDYKLSDTVHYT